MRLEVTDVSRVFKQGKREFCAVERANFVIESGDYVSITGDSGSGKTTFLNLVAGLLLPTSGEIRLDGQPLVGASDVELAHLRNTKIGYVPQGYSLLASLTVLDNVRLPFYLAKRSGNPEVRARRILERLGVASLETCYPRHLSGGELRRVAVARALINEPELLIADEPTNDLDVENATEIASLFRQIANEGTAVLMVTHNLDTVKTADQNCVMHHGIIERN